MQSSPASPGAPLLRGGVLVRCLCLVAAFLLPRLAYIAKSTIWSDEAVFGLMALAIGRGIEYPLYCWGAHYASALISYISVPLIAIFGVSTFVFKSATLGFGITMVLLMYFALRRRFGETHALVSALFLALPPPTFLVMSIAGHGGYPETFFLGIAIWAIAMDLVSRRSAPGFALLGFLIGTSFSILWLGVPFIVSAIGLLAVRRRLLGKEAIYGGFGALMGLVPFLYYNIVVAPGATVLRLAARSGEVTAGDGIADAIRNRVTGVPRWVVASWQGLDVCFSPYGGAPAAALLLGAVLIGAWRLRRDHRDWSTLILAFLIATAAFNFAGNLTRPRIFTPLCLAIVVSFAGLGRRFGTVLLALLVAVNVITVTRYLRNTNPDMRLIEFARKVHEIRPDAIVGDYELAYGVAFLAGTDAPVSAVGPPSPGDRRPDWTEQARSARRPAIVLPVSRSEEFERALAVRGILSGNWARFRSGDSFLYLLELEPGEGRVVMETVADLN